VTVAAGLDPVRLAEFAFGHSHWETPAAILRAILRPHARVAVKGCHASGKTFAAADAILVALLFRGDVVTTAPTDDQVRGQLWRQVNETVRDGRIPLREWGEVNQTEIRLPTGERAYGRATNQGVRFHGEHARPGRFLLVIVDEAPGVIPQVMGAIEGMRAGGDVRVLIQGNPLDPSGAFFEAFYPPTGAETAWDTCSIGAFDTPNLRGLTLDSLLALPEHELDNNERPYLITRRYVAEKYREWGPEHWEWQGRVEARFPLQAPDALLALPALEAAMARPHANTVGISCQAGVDVAGPGEDETALCIRQGGTVLEEQAWPDADPRGKLVAALERYRGVLDLINVDSVGLGWGIYLHLKDHFGNVVRPVNVGEAPTNRQRVDSVKFLDLRAEVYWNLRDWLLGGTLAGFRDRMSITQLAGIRYWHDHEGRIVIEPKKKAVERGIRSPDRAEATILAFWMDPRPLRQAQYGTRMPLRRVGRRG
jgi:phage terminase large subunit